MALSIAIVGLPNVGKSTLFNTLTENKVEASNYPFCTIDPNVGIVKVPDVRLTKLAEVSKPKEIIPTVIEFVDIAGLVRGANEGEGLGNQFLSHIRECDAICEVVRDFENTDIIHVDGKINPEGDRETIDTELLLADLSMTVKVLDKCVKNAKSGNKDDIKLRDIIKKIKEGLEEGVAVREMSFDDKEDEIVGQYNFLSKKPIIYVLNVSESEERADILKWSENTVKLDIKLENEIASLDKEERIEYIKELGLNESGLDKLVRASYGLLNLITFFTTGEDETRAWTVKEGSIAPVAAGRIHSDIEEGFIRAEVIDLEKFIEAGGESKAREEGLIRIEGKDYKMKDGDVCHFLHNK